MGEAIGYFLVICMGLASLGAALLLVALTIQAILMGTKRW